MMDFARYKNTKPYPAHVSKPILKGDTAQDHREYADALEQFAKDEEVRKAARVEYDNETYEMNKMFRRDLLAELGLTDHPKAGDFYSYVWDKGHAHGYSEIHTVACNVVDLMNYNITEAVALGAWVNSKLK